MRRQFAVVVLLLSSCSDAARVKRSLAEEMAGDDTMCQIKGPDGSGVSYGLPLPEKSCKSKCRREATFDKDKHFANAFTAASQEGDKCECGTSDNVKIVGQKDDAGEASIKWVQPFVKANDCTPASCWEFYKSAYDIGRPRAEMLRAAGSHWKGVCSKDAEAGYTLGNTVFYHVRRQADRTPTILPPPMPEEMDGAPDALTSSEPVDERWKWMKGAKKPEAPKPATQVQEQVTEQVPVTTVQEQVPATTDAKATGENLNVETTSEGDWEDVSDAGESKRSKGLTRAQKKKLRKKMKKQQQKRRRAKATTFNEVLTKDLSMKGASPIDIQEAAKTIVEEIQIFEDPWLGWKNYLADVMEDCNIDENDFEQLQAVEEWYMAPEKLHVEKVCQANADACKSSLASFPGMQADGSSNDPECDDAIDKMQRLIVSFSWCKVVDEQRKQEAAVQEALHALEAPLKSCDVTRRELLTFDPTITAYEESSGFRNALAYLGVESRQEVSQFPRVCAAPQCEDAVSQFAGVKQCNDPRCEDATGIFSNLVQVVAHCRYLKALEE